MSLVILTSMSPETQSVARVDGDDVVLLGGPKVYEDLDAAVPRGATAMLNWGAVGSCSPRVGVGNLCVATSVTTQDGQHPAPAARWSHLVARLLSMVNLSAVRQVSLYSGPVEVTNDAESKLKVFRQYGADVADMGTWAVARWADAHGLPWASVGAASDAFDQTVSNFADLVDGQGNIRVPNLIGELPTSLFTLIREAWTFEAAIHSLTQASRVLAANHWLLRHV